MITGRKELVHTCKTHLLQENFFKKGNANGVSCKCIIECIDVLIYIYIHLDCRIFIELLVSKQKMNSYVSGV